MTIQRLSSVLESIYRRYHSPRFLCNDPLQCVRPFVGTADSEIAALVAATLAYGRVEQIVRTVRRVFEVMGGQPRLYVLETSLEQKRRDLRGFVHRFTSGDDVAALLQALAFSLREYGSLDSHFGRCLALCNGNLRLAAEHFTGWLIERAEKLFKGRMPGVEFLLPSPLRGSACKRLNMYFRWMIRADDGVDLGAWKCAKPALLIVPLDTHLWRTVELWKLTKRKHPDWKAAEEVTAWFRCVDPCDPVRFDFSICQKGMMQSRGRER